MERLTDKNDVGSYFYPKCFEKCDGLGASSKCDNCEIMTSICEKLGKYEDSEEQGRLFILPCKVGNTVYRYVDEKGCVLEYTVWNISMSAYESGEIDIVIEGCAESEEGVEDEISLSLIDFKNEFFNTKSEAEQKLKEMESD